ncbi:FkbM family methyltransferase [Caldichromatium japonicum]|uniref:FkbM family methyltransferase n=1 Tax=Caldichromatium japonicum TaxID=2699430 RepID=A0A6G7VE12_9GAMM|nr:FkbM family methyltransferase [Caldichromatium japonicum]QIK38192.1 FkbM family methyltransferase [Caldichromatium japonicum]
MASPTVSVALPVYNVAPYLRACLDSIIEQDFTDLEIICVNDGSTDESSAILEEYAQRDPRIRIVHQTNRGLASTRNTALGYVRGRYLMHVDSDDMLRPGAIRHLVEEIERTGADFIVFQHIMFDETHEFDNWYYDFDRWNLEPKTSLTQKLDILHYHYTWSKFFRVEFLNKYNFRFPDGLQFDDNVYHWKVLLAAEKVVVLPEKLYRYRMRAGSIMWHRGRHHLDIFRIFKEGIAHFREQGVYEAVFQDFMQYKMGLQYFWTRDIEPRFRYLAYLGILDGLSADEERFVRDYPHLLAPEALRFYERLFASPLYRRGAHRLLAAQLTARRYLADGRARLRQMVQAARRRLSQHPRLQALLQRLLGFQLMDPRCLDLLHNYQNVATYWVQFWRAYLDAERAQIPERLARLQQGLSEDDRALAEIFVTLYRDHLPACKDYSRFLLHKDLLWRPRERFRQAQGRPPVAARYQVFLEQYPWLSADVFAALYGLNALPRDIQARIRAGGDLIDGGAFIGDSSIQLAETCPNSRVLALEPDPVNFSRLQENIRQFALEEQIVAEPLGLHGYAGEFVLRHHGAADFPDQGTSLLDDFRDTAAHGGEHQLRGRFATIDALVERHGLRPVLIKLDIEGLEFEALRGAVETLRRYRPALIVSVYHHPKDFFEIKPWLEALDLGYYFALRRLDLQSPVSDLVLLCYPRLAELGGSAVAADQLDNTP